MFASAVRGPDGTGIAIDTLARGLASGMSRRDALRDFSCKVGGGSVICNNNGVSPGNCWQYSGTSGAGHVNLACGCASTGDPTWT
jgi:hypothetical protein